MPLVTLTAVALEMKYRDYTTRVCRGEVGALSDPLINEAQSAEKNGHPSSEHAPVVARR
jgi:hypothetical protein